MRTCITLILPQKSGILSIYFSFMKQPWGLPLDLAGFNELMAVTLQQYVLANLMLFSCLYYIYNGYINHIAEICFMN